MIAPGTPGKTLEDVAVALAEQNATELTYRPGSLRFYAQVEAGLIAKAAREQFRASRERARQVFRTLVGLLDDRRSRGDEA
ncbi:hypothetical protein [Haloarchaeobius sp. DYHT-AS-18]|uniref:hypothetical protein n=1 Tax=Haloarchaeobius sp. DYHT-AS-18 TaxID=3446117 RepID=UPI003EBFDA1C